MFLFFPFPLSNVPDNERHKQKWCMFVTYFKLVLACVNFIEIDQLSYQVSRILLTLFEKTLQKN